MLSKHDKFQRTCRRYRLNCLCENEFSYAQHKYLRIRIATFQKYVVLNLQSAFFLSLSLSHLHSENRPFVISTLSGCNVRARI